MRKLVKIKAQISCAVTVQPISLVCETQKADFVVMFHFSFYIFKENGIFIISFWRNINKLMLLL